MTDDRATKLRLMMTACVVLALIGGAASAAMAFDHWELLCQPLLLAFLSCWLVTMGSAGILAVGNLTGGHWATSTRPFLLAAVNTLPLVTILFVLIGFNLNYIYPWTPSHTCLLYTSDAADE